MMIAKVSFHCILKRLGKSIAVLSLRENIVLLKTRYHIGSSKKSFLKQSKEENNASKKMKWMEAASYQGLDTAIYKCLKSASHCNVPVDGKVFKFKTLKFAKELSF